MGLFFEWDTNKAKSNVLKHDVSFEEATSLFGDIRSLTIESPFNTVTEKRLVTLGMSSNKRLIVVVHTERNKKIRIISARPASRKERKQYQDETYSR